MNQSAILAASLLAGFGLFVASRDRLPVYARILWGEKPGTHSEGTQSEGEESGVDSDWFSDWGPFGQAENYMRRGELELPDLPDFPDFNWNLGN